MRRLTDMLVYIFDHTLDGLLTAVFDAFFLHQQPDTLLTNSDQLPLFCEQVHEVQTADEKAQRVWSGLEKRLSARAMKLILASYHSELPELDFPLFRYICKVFQQPVGARSIERNYADPDVMAVTNIARKVLHEQLRMKQFIRFQKAVDGTYLAVVSPDHNVLPLITNHFADRFRDQSWLIYDARRHYGFYHDGQQVTRVTFSFASSESQGNSTGTSFPAVASKPIPSELPFSLKDGKLDDALLSADDKLFQDLWRTYFKAICIRERINPRKQLNDMPRRYWRYMTEKQKSS